MAMSFIHASMQTLEEYQEVKRMSDVELGIPSQVSKTCHKWQKCPKTLVLDSIGFLKPSYTDYHLGV